LETAKIIPSDSGINLLFICNPVNDIVARISPVL